ncbi:6693_t:CDS:1, partial [Funneliformis geosporum]
NGQPQNEIAEVSAVDISDSVIGQQKDFNTKSIEDKEIGDFILEEPADVFDSVIVQPKQCKPPQIEEVTTK